MALKVAINGFGRIGRSVMRAAKQVDADIDFVAVNDLGNPETMAFLLNNDSIYGPAPFEMAVDGDKITIDGDATQFLSVRNPAEIPWGDFDVDVVIEATGIFKTKAQASMHLEGGAKKVIVSAPSSDVDAMVVVGVNDDELTADDKVVSNASCTTNCLSPMVKVLDEAFGFQQGLLTTVHAYTGTQNLVDAPHKDLRRARAAAINLVPTSTGAAKATGQVLTQMAGRLDGIAMRVPLAAGSATDFVGMLDGNVSIDQINEAYKVAAEGELKGIVGYSYDAPLVSTDIVGRSESCIFDSGMTMAMPTASGETMFKVLGWYDNETGYSHRVVDLALKMGAL